MSTAIFFAACIAACRGLMPPLTTCRRRVVVGASRVLVCGPTRGENGQTVSDAVASALRNVEVYRWSGQGRPTTCDAAVLCCDGDESSTLEAQLAMIIESNAGSAPASVVVVAPVEKAPHDEAPSFQSWLFPAPRQATARDVAATASAAGASRVAVVRHGPLFGGDYDEPAFVEGLVRMPTLADDFGRRSARLVPGRQGGEFSTRRGTVGRAAAETVARSFEGRVEFDVRSVLGSELSDDEWRGAVDEAIEDSDLRCAFRANTTNRPGVDFDSLTDWISEGFGPLIYRMPCTRVDEGPRPIAFIRPENETNDELVKMLFWEDIDNKLEILRVGELNFTYDGTLFSAIRDRDDALIGEVEIIDAMADSFNKRFPLELPVVAEPVVAEEQVAAPARDDEPQLAVNATPADAITLSAPVVEEEAPVVSAPSAEGTPVVSAPSAEEIPVAPTTTPSKKPVVKKKKPSKVRRASVSPRTKPPPLKKASDAADDLDS